MKKKFMILIIASILTVGGISVAYAASGNDIKFNNVSRQMMGTQNSKIQSNNSINNMIKTMKDNGFNDEANAMANRDLNAMNKLMTNLNVGDYKKMINIMQKNGYTGYTSVTKMMQSVSSDNAIKTHQSMMEQ